MNSRVLLIAHFLVKNCNAGFQLEHGYVVSVDQHAMEEESSTTVVAEQNGSSLHNLSTPLLEEGQQQHSSEAAQRFSSLQDVNIGSTGSHVNTVNLLTRSNNDHTDDEEALQDFYRLFDSNRQEINPPVSILNNEGRVPEWLNGVFLRNGPGSWDVKSGGRSLQGWIDGYAKMEQFVIEHGQVQFGTKFLRSSFYNRSQDDVAFAFGIVGEVSPPFEKKGLIESVLATTDNSQINVWPFANDTIAITGDFQLRDYKIDPHTLDMDTFRFEGRPKLFGGRTSHPQHAVGRTDISYSVTIPFMEVPLRGYHMCLNEISSGSHLGGRLQRAEVACHWIPRLTNFHSVAISPNYALLYDSPLSAEVDMMQVMRGNIKVEMGWNPEGKTRVLVSSLDKSKRKRFRELELPTAAYCGHVVNTWEEPVVADISNDSPGQVDLVTDWECTDGKKIKWLLSGCTPHRFCPHPAQDADFAPAIWRFRFRLQPTKDSFEILGGGLERKYQLHFPEQPQENFYSLLMSANYDYRGRPYCYVYSFGIHESKSQWFLTKTNLCDSGDEADATGHIPALSERWYEPGHVPTEPTFVPRPGASDEDDGVVISTVHDTKAKQTYLAVFDAKTLTLLSKSFAPMQSIFGLHGRFFDLERQRSY